MVEILHFMGEGYGYQIPTAAAERQPSVLADKLWKGVRKRTLEELNPLVLRYAREQGLDGALADKLRSYVGKELLFGVRPEDLVYSETAAPGDTVTAKVTVVEPLGSEILLYVNTEHHQIIVKLRKAPPLRPACNQLKAFINQNSPDATDPENGGVLFGSTVISDVESRTLRSRSIRRTWVRICCTR